MAPERPLLAVLLAALLLPGCAGRDAGTWEFAPIEGVTDGTPVRDLTEPDLARLPRKVVVALDAAAAGEGSAVDLTKDEAQALRAVIPANPAVVRHRGALVGIAQTVIAG